MKIIDETNDKVPFSEIEIGECFKAEDSFYIKIVEVVTALDCSFNHFNCVDIETGDLDWFVNTFKVCPVEGELHFRSKT